MCAISIALRFLRFFLDQRTKFWLVQGAHINYVIRLLAISDTATQGCRIKISINRDAAVLAFASLLAFLCQTQGALTMTRTVSLNFRALWFGAAGLTFLMGISPTALTDDAARAKMQRELNAEILAASFDPGDIDKAKAYADAAIKKNVKPVSTPPSYWQPGWNCGHLTRYRHYRYKHYRNCIYHHRYYGRYW
jgi:hypothetical protein